MKSGKKKRNHHPVSLLFRSKPEHFFRYKPATGSFSKKEGPGKRGMQPSLIFSRRHARSAKNQASAAFLRTGLFLYASKSSQSLGKWCAISSGAKSLRSFSYRIAATTFPNFRAECRRTGACRCPSPDRRSAGRPNRSETIHFRLIKASCYD